MPKYQQFSSNVAVTATRRETLEGRDYIVAPMAMLAQGVITGNNGPLFYPEDELAQAPQGWNHKPIVVYHPEINGQPVSACEPTILNNRKVGIILNSQYDGKLRAEAWLEIARLDLVDKRIKPALEANSVMEISTGLFTENEETAGEYNGQSYSAIARKFSPDHLALLPDKIGAYSVAAGGGLLQTNQVMVDAIDVTKLKDGDTWERVLVPGSVGQTKYIITKNEMSFDQTRQQLGVAIRLKYAGVVDALGYPESVYVCEVYTTFLIYEGPKSNLYKIGYSKSDTGVTLIGEPVEVVRVTEYRTKDGNYIANSAHKETNTMNKAEKVSGLIANKATKFAEKDRLWLMTMNDDQLAVLEPPEAKKEEPTTPAPEQPATPPNPAQPNPTPPTPPPANPPVVPAQQQNANLFANMTPEQYVNNAPPKIRDMLSSGLAAHQKERATLIGAITANSANQYTAAELEEMQTSSLTKLAALCAPPVENHSGALFFGNQGVAPVTTNANGDADVLVAPSYDFSKKR